MSEPKCRIRQVLGWIVFGLFLIGIFFSPIGIWTSPILGVWFVGTQRPRRGFEWQLAFAFLPALFSNISKFPLTGFVQSGAFVVWMFLTAVLMVLPFLFHRLTSPYLPGFVSTLPFPLAVTALRVFLLPVFPSKALSLYGLASGATLGAVVTTFLASWLAAAVIWMWNHEPGVRKIASCAVCFCLVAVVCEIFVHRSGAPMLARTAFASVCLAGFLILTAYAQLQSIKQKKDWSGRAQTVAMLRSPHTGEPLQLQRQSGKEFLTSASGERFPIRNGMPVFLKPEELTGDNRKYNHLYETIGGFYDDTQRVVSALSGFDRDDYVMSYLGHLEVKPGDYVLETSVGTGLNFKYLPRDTHRFGLDLSPEMLANCQRNLNRWYMDADLFIGNAECLPFADASFDVVFHVGGINFFNDRAKAIREMIRVAKPGTKILIADETEEHVQRAYERSPITSHYYKNRKEAVAAPIDLVPPEMQEIHLDILNVIGKNRFYALTFRKPLDEAESQRNSISMNTSALS